MVMMIHVFYPWKHPGTDSPNRGYRYGSAQPRGPPCSAIGSMLDLPLHLLSKLSHVPRHYYWRFLRENRVGCSRARHVACMPAWRTATRGARAGARGPFHAPGELLGTRWREMKPRQATAYIQKIPGRRRPAVPRITPGQSLPVSLSLSLSLLMSM